MHRENCHPLRWQMIGAERDKNNLTSHINYIKIRTIEPCFNVPTTSDCILTSNKKSC